jgi:hypothetical protein
VGEVPLDPEAVRVVAVLFAVLFFVVDRFLEPDRAALFGADRRLVSSSRTRLRNASRSSLVAMPIAVSWRRTSRDTNSVTHSRLPLDHSISSRASLFACSTG